MINAIKIAQKSNEDIPIGCVIKKKGVIIAKSHNKREKNNDITAHAEILAIKQAQKKLKSSRLTGCEIYVTLEPCPMCAWAIVQSGISALYFGSYNKQYGAIESVIDLPQLGNSKMKIYGGIEEAACDKMLNDFFEKIRKQSIYDNKK